MLASQLLAFAASAAAVAAQAYQGFNYASVFTDNSPITQQDYENEFNTAKNLVGTSGFTSARLYTIIQAGTTNSPTEAIPAAIATKTSLLLGLFLSNQAAFDNELAALQAAIATYGTAFVDLIAGISVGSEDLYRISPIGIENHSNPGLGPDAVVNYISQLRKSIAGTAASSKPVGHVDTWTAWVNGSNSAVINAVDFLGTDAYPYFQNTMSNAIESGKSLFSEAYQATVGAAGGKPVWVTETGWPVSGPASNLAVASISNAKTYWDQVGCSLLFGKVNTFWYTLQDAYPTTPSPSFGVVGTTLSTTPLYDLSCSDSSSPSDSSSSTSSKSSSAVMVSTASSKVLNTAANKATAPPEGPESQAASSASSPVQSAAAGGNSQNTAQGQTSGEISTPVTAPHSGPSVKTVVTYTTVTTCPVTITSGSEIMTRMTTSEVVATSSVGSTLSKVSKAQSATQQGSSPAQSASAGSCPTTLSGSYQYPHLIVDVDQTQPSKALGNSYHAHISSTVSSIFNFDIPPSYEGKTCSLVFLFPEKSQLTTSSYSVTGNGGLDFARLESAATEQTTYDTVPAVAKGVGSVPDLQAGNNYVIASGPCVAGQRIGYEVSATGSLDLEFFQDFNEPPIGLYVTAC